MPARNAAGTRRRETILQHAADLASVEGLEGLTIGRLAGELEMSKSGLFEHFGSKEGLQVATVETAKAKLWSEVVEPASTATPGLDRLRALIEGYIGYLQREVFPGGCFLSAASAEFDGRPGPVRDVIATAMRAWGAELETHAGIALRQGELPDGTDPAQLVFELGAFATRANALFQLYRDPAVFERARVAVTKALG
ncbi:TetR/AcrR family transcriptional regulator [Solirubrobacter taibaiensis]|nr:TetR/AcrR family transcriptional regulator [Solirubrobacter taibaiensis]